MKILIALLLLTLSCAPRRAGNFLVVPQKPEYLLRAPDAKDTPFPQILGRHTKMGTGWLDLRPHMALRGEAAYYHEGAPRTGLSNYLGTEAVRFHVQSSGRIGSPKMEKRLPQLPRDQAAVENLVPSAQRRYRHHRFFYAIVFKQKGNTSGSVLLGAKTPEELDRLSSKLLNDPDSVCGPQSVNCTVFPPLCTVSVEMEIMVNGTRRTAPWGSFLGNIVPREKNVAVLREFQGKLTPVQLDPSDPTARRLPLLPGDRITAN